MKRLLCLLFLIGCLISAGCKRKYDDTVISGYVTDSISGAALNGVSMQLKSGTFFYGTSKAQTLSDANGYYKMVYDTPSEGGFSLPVSYEVFAVKEGYGLKRAEVKPGTNSTRNFQIAEKFLQVTFTHFNYYNSDSTRLTIDGEGINAITDSWTCYAIHTPCTERIYSMRADTNLLITITRYKSGISSTSSYTEEIKGDKPIVINMPV